MNFAERDVIYRSLSLNTEEWPLPRRQALALRLALLGMPTFAGWVFKYWQWRFSKPRLAGALDNVQWDCVFTPGKGREIQWDSGVDYYGIKP